VRESSAHRGKQLVFRSKRSLPVFRLVGAKISVGLVPDPAGNFVLPAIMLGERDDPK
jgi:hypothetical protein